MEWRRPLLIHRNEWERIKNEANPEMQDKSHVSKRKIDIEAMNEQSQKWLSKWPDSVQGVVNKVALKEEKKRLAEKAEIDEFRNRKKHDNTATLKKARDMIFERTCHGKELLRVTEIELQLINYETTSSTQIFRILIYDAKSFLTNLQMSTWDEREMQIKFKKEMLEKEKKIDEEKSEVANIMYAEFEKGESDRLIQEQIHKANAAYNKVVADMKREDDLRAAAIEEINRHEDEKNIEKFNQLQLLQEKPDYCFDKEGLKLYEQQNKAIKKMRETRENLDKKLADIQCKYQDRIRCREKQILDQIYKEKHNTSGFQQNYELVQRIQNKEEEKYNDFVNKGIKRREKRFQAREKAEYLKKHEQQRSKSAQAENLETLENRQKKCCCDKQSFLPTARRGKHEQRQSKMVKETTPPRPPSFLAPSTALQQALKQRQMEASGWSGTDGANKHFAEYASGVLAEATHKHLVRKVINSYCKTNIVKDLQVPGY